jgi:hypothetical protein
MKATYAGFTILLKLAAFINVYGRNVESLIFLLIQLQAVIKKKKVN